MNCKHINELFKIYHLLMHHEMTLFDTCKDIFISFIESTMDSYFPFDMVSVSSLLFLSFVIIKIR